MKTTAIRKLRQNLAADTTLYGLWVTLESPSITEMAVALGLDFVVIDAEHGHLDWKEILEHLRATVRSDTVALVRIAELNGSLIKRVLDIGADGIVIPWVETADQLRQAVTWARYPLEGMRGIGAERATCWGQALGEHASEANEHVLVVPIIETVRTAQHVEQMCKVDGVEILWFGPADYSSTAGYRGQWEGPGVADQILQMKETIRRAGKQCGVMATSHENLQQRRDQGFRLIGAGSDTGLLVRALRASLSVVDRDQPLRTSFAPEVRRPSEAVDPLANPSSGTALEGRSTNTLKRPPESMRPDRPEAITAVGKGLPIDVAPGIRLECHVGSHNQARQLTTGLVTFSPSATLPCHTHTFTESLTLLSGSATIEVEGRTYLFQKLDNVVIPAGIAHMARNNSTTEPALFHVALATDNPTRTIVTQSFPHRAMPDDSIGEPGAERINRCKRSPRYSAGPNTEFVDFFHLDLMPGIEMSGGYGLFHRTGRLPAHVHDFDESICIVSGRATCVVEGRRYAMSDRATAMVPRGRVHYFMNESFDPMEMIWVYAGAKPDRIVVEESCATAEGNPWR